MITTVTLNVAMDRALVVPNFLGGRRHRASSTVTLPGGKGVTIARSLKRLGSPVIATGLAGGLTGGNVVDRLTDEGILNDMVRISEPSRTSTAVIDPVTGVHTEINEYGPRVRPEELELLLEKVRYLARASRCVVLAGSLPRDVPSDVYQRVARAMQSQRVATVVTQPNDAEVLRLALQAEPALTVVEQREAEDLIGHEFTAADDFMLALEQMARSGGQSIAIMHPTGCYARVKQGRSIRFLQAGFEPVEAVSQLGFTDCFVAGVLHATMADRPVDERIALGLATAIANLRMLGAGRFEPAEAIRMERDIEVRDLQLVEVEVEAEH